MNVAQQENSTILVTPELAPCIAVIGPANSGKSTLLHLLNEALQNHEDAPLAYVVKGNPDGSGRYLYRSPDLRGTQKGEWTSTTLEQVIEWVQNARRHLELVLVDVGGKRDETALPGNLRLFQNCSHYLVVAPKDAAEGKDMQAWIKDAKDAGLESIAELESCVRQGRSSFNQDTKKGVFRRDATSIDDPMNRSVSRGLMESMMGIRIVRTMPAYFDLRFHLGRWNDESLPSLGGNIAALQEAIRLNGQILLGGIAPIYAYSAALHHAMDARSDAQVRVFDPKVRAGEVLIPRLVSDGEGVSKKLLDFEWEQKDEILRLKLIPATEDKFLQPEVLDKLPSLKIPESPRALKGESVAIDGAVPTWLHLTLSLWARSQGAAQIGHWDANFKREVLVWPLSSDAAEQAK